MTAAFRTAAQMQSLKASPENKGQFEPSPHTYLLREPLAGIYRGKPTGSAMSM